MTKPKVDLTGSRFGKLTVMRQAEDYVYENGKRRTQWECRCDCGNTVFVEQSNLKRGNSSSCGCLCRELNIRRSTKHGDKHTRLYRIWCGIKCRCQNENSTSYENYGARGITMCKEWQDSYTHFKEWALNNGYTETNHLLSIDRLDVNGDYTPENCKWSNPKEQANNRRNTAFITFNNESHSLSEWSDIVGIKYHTLFARIYKLGWDLGDALRPSQQNNI